MATKTKYVPAEGYDRVTVAAAASDELVVAETSKPFETDDPALEAELDTNDLLVRADAKAAKGKDE
jgi:hypothetical protein